VYLDISRTAVTARGLACVKRLKGLKYVDISHTPIGAAGLAELKQLTGVEWILVDPDQFETPECDELQKALPDCAIQCRPMLH
jgi:hypothetical protein